MGTLSYSATVSVDGFAAPEDRSLDWGSPSGDVFALHLERIAAVSTEVLGRTTYALMRYWETEPEGSPWTEPQREFARHWARIERIVASSTLTASDLGPGDRRMIPHLTLDALSAIVDQASGEVEIFGPTLAAHAIRAGLVSDFRFLIVPRMLGGGLRALPAGVDLPLTLVEHRLLDGGWAYAHYRAPATPVL